MTPSNKRYTGERLSGPQGQIHGVRVLVNGRPLSHAPSLEVVNHSPTGFEWGYGGSGPDQLALALILDATGDRELAERSYQWFKWACVSQWPDRWEITSARIVLWLRQWARETDAPPRKKPRPVVGCVAVRRCRACGCTDDDCRACIAATGSPCSWVEGEPDLCTRCADEEDAALVREIEGDTDAQQ